MTLVELCTVLVALSLLGLVIVPMLGAARQQARGMSSAQKLMVIGQSGMMYAQDNANRLFSYTWRAGGVYVMPDGRTKTPISDQDAAALQNQEILARRTDRVRGIYKIQNASARLPQRRFTHLVLMDYLDAPFPSDLFIDPNDANQFVWSANPLEYGPDSSVPYAKNAQPGYDSDPNWSSTPVRQRWAFGSSYQVVPDAWQPSRFGQRYIPVAETPHLLQFVGNPNVEGWLSNGRKITDVLHNANKVWMYEEFDRDRADPLYFGYDDAECEKLMFDGSVNSWASGIAAPSVVPEHGIYHWQQKYVPLDTFPLPTGGLGDSTLVSQRYRWTYAGLAGINYGPFSFERSASGRD